MLPRATAGMAGRQGNSQAPAAGWSRAGRNSRVPSARPPAMGPLEAWGASHAVNVDRVTLRT